MSRLSVENSATSAMIRPVAASQRGSKAPIAAGTARPAISSPNGTTLPGPPVANARSCSARTSGGEASTAGRPSVQVTSPEMLRNAAASTPPASAMIAPGAIIALAGGVDRQRDRGRELEEPADRDRVLILVE